jgi:hypothetical protein
VTIDTRTNLLLIQDTPESITTIPHALTRRTGPPDETRVGNPSGLVSVGAEVEQRGGSWAVDSAVLFRTARRLMQGEVAVPMRLAGLAKDRAREGAATHERFDQSQAERAGRAAQRGADPGVANALSARGRGPGLRGGLSRALGYPAFLGLPDLGFPSACPSWCNGRHPQCR